MAEKTSEGKGKGKKERYTLLNAKNSKELAYRSLSLLSGNYNDFINNIKPILKSIDILVLNKRIELENSIVKRIHFKSVLNQIYEKANNYNNPLRPHRNSGAGAGN